MILRRQEAEPLRHKGSMKSKRVEYLEGLLAQWINAKQIREFLILAEKLPINPVGVDMEKQEWLEWAKGYANRLDQLVLRARPSEF